MTFYDTPTWKAVRARVLRRDKYQDALLARYGKKREAEIVHHIFPRERYPQYQYEMWNLISVSRATHNRLHIRDTDELTEMGLELMERTAKKQGLFFAGGDTEDDDEETQQEEENVSPPL